MAVALVQSKVVVGGPITPNSTPTPGNLMVLFAATRSTGAGPFTIAGWTPHSSGVLTTTAHHLRDHMAFYRVAQVGDTSWLGGGTYTGTVFTFAEFSGVGSNLDDEVGTIVGNTNTVVCGGAVTTSAQALMVGGCAADFTNDTETMSTAPSASVTEISDKGGASASPGYWTGYRVAAAGTYTIGGTATMGSGGTTHGMAGHTFAFLVTAAPEADFTSDVTQQDVGGTVAFTDLSTNAPTSWAWTFGDGGTSTSQDPTHVYTAAGTYTVSLTATNADGSDTETKTAYLTVVLAGTLDPVAPGRALIEIYASEVGSARWDQVNWDEAVWSMAGWQDVTPQSVEATVVWGSSEPELGILSRPSAGSWSIDTYDPERLLDPANEDSQYFGDLEPGLPIRITHRGLVVRQGLVESMSYRFSDDRGFIRVQDNIARLANAAVPDDIDLGDTLYARARAAIAAAGLQVTVLADPPSGDPALVPWVTGTNRTAWQWITDAAESVLHIPYIDRIGRLGFRPWATPLARARDLTATELIDLTSLVQYDGLYSVVNALDDDGVTVVERASTPPPRYGARTYSRNSATPNVEDWLEAVLADRVRSGRRWLPGTVYPLTADSVEKYATIEAVELVSLSNLYTDPAVSRDIIIVGGRVNITAKKDSEAKWWFDFQAAETAQTPLITEDASGFVVSEDGSVFLYPE